MIVRTRPTDTPDARALVLTLMGRTVRVLHLRYGELWQLEEPLRVENVRLQCGYTLLCADITAIDDYYLMPIDGLPVTDDVTDEVTA
jgi:hypothetical protein